LKAAGVVTNDSYAAWKQKAEDAGLIVAKGSGHEQTDILYRFLMQSWTPATDGNE